MKRTIVALIALITLISCTPRYSIASESPTPTSAEYIDLFVKAGLPVDKIFVFDEETDPNNLLGRPGEYTSKASFTDKRLDQIDEDDPNGGTIEVFETKKDMLSRKRHIENMYDLFPILKMYIFVSADELAILRISYDLTPKKAKEYSDIFLSHR